MRQIAILLLLSGLLAACGSLPRPFVHDEEGPALAQPLATQPIAVTPIPALPGLAEAMIAAFAELDIPASLATGGDHFLQMTGEVEKGRVRWRLVDAEGKQLAEAAQPLPRDKARYQEAAAIAAESIGHVLRNEDMGGADLAARQRVAVDEVTVSNGLDAALLKRSLIAALEQQNLAVVSDQAKARVSGWVRITPGPGGHDLVEVTWVVKDSNGVEVGKVNQGNSVMRDEILGQAAQMAHQIAEGGAEGIVQLVKIAP